MPTGTRGGFISGNHYNEVRSKFPAPHTLASGSGGNNFPPAKKTAMGGSDPGYNRWRMDGGSYSQPDKHNSQLEIKLSKLGPDSRETHTKTAPIKKSKSSYPKEK